MEVDNSRAYSMQAHKARAVSRRPKRSSKSLDHIPRYVRHQMLSKSTTPTKVPNLYYYTVKCQLLFLLSFFVKHHSSFPVISDQAQTKRDKFVCRKFAPPTLSIITAPPRLLDFLSASRIFVNFNFNVLVNLEHLSLRISDLSQEYASIYLSSSNPQHPSCRLM